MVNSYKFRYNGEVRHLDNVSFESKTHTLLGMEVRKAGKFSFKFKRFRLDSIEDKVEKIDNWYISPSIYEDINGKTTP